MSVLEVTNENWKCTQFIGKKTTAAGATCSFTKHCFLFQTSVDKNSLKKILEFFFFFFSYFVYSNLSVQQRNIKKLFIEERQRCNKCMPWISLKCYIELPFRFLCSVLGTKTKCFWIVVLLTSLSKSTIVRGWVDLSSETILKVRDVVVNQQF